MHYQQLMPANHKVSVAWQIVFTFIPIVNFWVFYRIRKLRKYLLYVFVPCIVISLISYALLLSFVGLWVEQPISPEDLGPSEIWQPRSFDYWHVFVLSNIVGFAFQGFEIYLAIIWSRQQNQQFDHPTTPTEQP